MGEVFVLSYFRRFALVGLLIGPLASCALFSDDQSPVFGMWGGSQIELTATRSGIAINWWCYQVAFPGPVPLIHGDSFAVNGKITASSWAPEVGQPYRLSGIIAGDTLAMTYSYLRLGSADTWEGPWTMKLAAGPGMFQEFPCAE